LEVTDGAFPDPVVGGALICCLQRLQRADAHDATTYRVWQQIDLTLYSEPNRDPLWLCVVVSRARARSIARSIHLDRSVDASRSIWISVVIKMDRSRSIPRDGPRSRSRSIERSRGGADAAASRVASRGV